MEIGAAVTLHCAQAVKVSVQQSGSSRRLLSQDGGLPRRNCTRRLRKGVKTAALGHEAFCVCEIAAVVGDVGPAHLLRQKRLSDEADV